MGVAITAEEMRTVPYLRTDEIGGRQIVLLPFWERGRWALWIPRENGTLLELKPRALVRDAYVAKERAHVDDYFSHFLDRVFQRLSWPGVLAPAHAISADLENMAASLGKLEFFWASRTRLKGCLGQFAATEVEYVFTVAKSILDHLQELLGVLWERTRMHGALETPLQPLPKTMRGLLFDKRGNLRTREQLEAEFSLPPPLADFYLARAPFISRLGELRNAIVHRGHDVGPIFIAERGYAVAARGDLFELASDVWTADHRVNENLVSMKPLLSYVVRSTLQACSEAVGTYLQLIECPSEMMPGHTVFMRMPQAGALHRIEAVLDGGVAWWDANDFKDDEPS